MDAAYKAGATDDNNNNNNTGCVFNSRMVLPTADPFVMLHRFNAPVHNGANGNGSGSGGDEKVRYSIALSVGSVCLALTHYYY